MFRSTEKRIVEENLLRKFFYRILSTRKISKIAKKILKISKMFDFLARNKNYTKQNTFTMYTKTKDVNYIIYNTRKSNIQQSTSSYFLYDTAQSITFI